MEFIFELLFEIIVEGSIELSTHKKVPMPIRILTLVLCLGIFGTIAGAIILVGFDCLSKNNIGAAVMMFVIGGFLIIGFFYMLRKAYKENTKENDENRPNPCEAEPSRKGQMIVACVSAIVLVIIGLYVLYTFDLFE